MKYLIRLIGDRTWMVRNIACVNIYLFISALTHRAYCRFNCVYYLALRLRYKGLFCIILASQEHFVNVIDISDINKTTVFLLYRDKNLKYFFLLVILFNNISLVYILC